MLQIVILATLIFGNSGSLTLQEQKVEKIEEAIHFSESKVNLAIENISDHVEEADSEIGELLEKVEPEMDASFEREMARESATILKKEMALEEELEQVNPTYEDLSELVATPPVTMADDEIIGTLYDNLKISIDEKVTIGKLMMTLAENSAIKLLFERKRLEGWGQDINHVHPLRFLGTVFANPRLVHCMRRIRTSSFKWDAFIDGFSVRFKEEIASNNVLPYLTGFAESIGVDETPLQKYVNNQDFEGLVLYLMKEKSQ